MTSSSDSTYTITTNYKDSPLEGEFISLRVWGDNMIRIVYRSSEE